MKPEQEIVKFVENLRRGEWLQKANPYWQEDTEIPIGVVIWFVPLKCSVGFFLYLSFSFSIHPF